MVAVVAVAVWALLLIGLAVYLIVAHPLPLAYLRPVAAQCSP